MNLWGLQSQRVVNIFIPVCYCVTKVWYHVRGCVLSCDVHLGWMRVDDMVDVSG